MAALWSVRGVGPVTITDIQRRFGALGQLLDVPIRDWCDAITWRGAGAEHIVMTRTLGERADILERRCQAQRTSIAFPGDLAWPDRLDDCPDAPAILFHQGPGANAPRRRRLAVVGSRTPQAGVAQRVGERVMQLSRSGLGIVSGAAEGIDQAAHCAALKVQGETWAFMGMALDQIDAGRRTLARAILDGGGTLFSQFPPGARANMSSFTQRNKLISGASDAVLVCQASTESGSLHTANFAKEQGRPVLVVPFDLWNEAGEGGNRLLRAKKAEVFLDAADAMKAVGLEGNASHRDVPPFDASKASAHGQSVFGALRRGAAGFEDLRIAFPDLSAGQLASALVELEVLGAVIHKGGRRYEKR